jgi:formamidopyrimidine-DNA glycosylase
MSTTNTQIKVLTDLVKSLLEAMEGQTSAVEELKKEHANQIEVLTRTFTQQIETLKAQVTEMTEKIETQHHTMVHGRTGGCLDGTNIRSVGISDTMIASSKDQ